MLLENGPSSVDSRHFRGNHIWHEQGDEQRQIHVATDVASGLAAVTRV